MNYTNTGKGVEISEMTLQELVVAIKMNFNFIFTSKENNGYPVHAFNVTKEGYKYAINKDVVNYDELLKNISDYLQQYTFTITLSKEDWDNYQHLILISEKINKSLISNCLRISYEPKEKMYFIKFPDKNKLPNEVYYFASNDSILMFNEKGPKLLISETTSIEDILID